MRRLFVLGVAMFMLVSTGGCGEETIDASSKEAFDESVQRITELLPDDAKKEEFMKAMQLLTMKNLLFAPGTDITNEADVMKKMKEVFGGKTAAQVIEAAKKAKAESDAEMKKLMDGK